MSTIRLGSRNFTARSKLSTEENEVLPPSVERRKHGQHGQAEVRRLGEVKDRYRNRERSLVQVPLP